MIVYEEINLVEAVRLLSEHGEAPIYVRHLDSAFLTPVSTPQLAYQVTLQEALTATFFIMKNKED